ncbi:TetR/AcrR family transcriptional regulator [Solihabitans fulvus]|uniref:TetR/AcrR family transcriptional regulator n=1 Tax=Solihabitans fulvus TaxID=1892852 RepID=A0A5B2WSW4_9PSEU|nr:TetR/AcrR family transcriptional regulator [Solihabitans fulvus]KAA2254048.1 TetR/AcrR family transcriptional regulator [Solihabitans fulvus]
MAGRVATRSLADIAETAARVFTQRGYRETGISDVSKALGLSHGALYTYVQSKEALLYVALAWSIGPDLLNGLDTPVQLSAEEEIVALARRWTEAEGFPRLAAALTRRRIHTVREEFGEIVDELYSFIEDNKDVLALVAQCARELPEMFQFWFVQRRRGHFDALNSYLRKRIRSGHLREVPDVATAARFIAETVAWFAWHRLGDPDSAMLTDDQCRVTVRHLLTSAFLGDS